MWDREFAHLPYKLKLSTTVVCCGIYSTAVGYTDPWLKNSVVNRAMQTAVHSWLGEINCADKRIDGLAQRLQKSYVVYGCMALLPMDAINGLLDVLESKGSLTSLLEVIARHLRVTHIATAKPIPLCSEDGDTENIIRAPKSFTPLYGDFGPTTCSEPPAREDFDAAFWVTAKQNGILQTWAPRWTMFSRGNISEKSRLLTLPSVLSAVEDGKSNGEGCAAVDLYAGIGYFAFSYLKAGVRKVLCWDLNPWSIEGLRRGAKANRWAAKLIANDERPVDAGNEEVRLVTFSESNEHASQRIAKLRRSLPPIRHVNCGLLPTSRGTWKIAAESLDERFSGWVHVHENFGVNEIDQKAEEVRQEFQQLIGQLRPTTGEKCAGTSRQVELEHINRLKSYAPGVIHCVIDIHVHPSNPG